MKGEETSRRKIGEKYTGHWDSAFLRIPMSDSIVARDRQIP
jgi:hypothetical protein